MKIVALYTQKQIQRKLWKFFKARAVIGMRGFKNIENICLVSVLGTVQRFWHIGVYFISLIGFLLCVFAYLA